MNFLHVNLLLGLFLIPLMLGMHIYSQQQKKHLLRRFANEMLWPCLLSFPSVLNLRFKLLLLLGGMALGIIALSQPRMGFQWEEVQHRGFDIILAVDVSRSMLAEDISPNRLTRAKREVIDLLSMLQGDRVGLVVFAGISFTQSPLTVDYKAIEIFLDTLDTELIPVPGTAIAHALQTSMQAFSDSHRNSKAIILITDGEDHSGELQIVEKQAREAGVKIFVIGIGKTEGVPIPNLQGGFLKNKKGELVMSKLNEVALKELALSTGGSYAQSVTSDLDLEKIYLQDIRENLQRNELQKTRRRLWNEQFQWFVLAAILCWMIEPLLPSRSLRQNSFFP